MALLGAHYFLHISRIRVNIRTVPSLVFFVHDWDPNCLQYWGIVVYSVPNLVKMSLKWKTMEC